MESTYWKYLQTQIFLWVAPTTVVLVVTNWFFNSSIVNAKCNTDWFLMKQHKL